MSHGFRLLGLLAALSLIGGCEAQEVLQEIVPTITEVDGPTDATTGLMGVPVASSARVDTRGWGVNRGESDIYATYASSADQLRTPAATQLEASCTPSAADDTVFDCDLTASAPLGTWFFQWHIDWGETAADMATVSGPDPASSFTIAPAAADDEDDDTDPPPDPDPQEPLVILVPEDGSTCAGDHIGNNNAGSTIVRLFWGTESIQEGQALPGDYQVVVEHSGSPNCTDAADLGLDLTNPDAAWGYTPEGGCYVVPFNINETATPGLERDRMMRARVRRVLEGGSFGDFSEPVTFRTASPPLTAPTRLAPVGDTIELAGTVEASTVQFEFRAEGCPPTHIDYTLLQDEGDGFQAYADGSASCGTPEDPQLCVFQPAAQFYSEVTYNVNIVLHNQFGSHESGFNLTVE